MTMSCRQLIEFLDDYVAADLSPEVLAEFDRHMNECSHCREYLREYRQTMELSREAMDLDGPAPSNVPKELIDAMRVALRANRS